MGAALSAPVINDVSTSIEDPPKFKTSKHPEQLPERFKKAIQDHYSHLKPLTVPNSSLAAVFDAAKKAAASLPRARIVYEEPSGGVLELVDTTRLVRYKDDVVVRVRQVGGSTVVVDVRSASRVGRGDLGANAARIATYLAALRAELGLNGGS